MALPLCLGERGSGLGSALSAGWGSSGGSSRRLQSASAFHAAIQARTLTNVDCEGLGSNSITREFLRRFRDWPSATRFTQWHELGCPLQGNERRFALQFKKSLMDLGLVICSEREKRAPKAVSRICRGASAQVPNSCLAATTERCDVRMTQLALLQVRNKARPVHEREYIGIPMSLQSIFRLFSVIG